MKSFEQIKIILMILFLTATTGCTGFTGGGNYYGDEVIVQDESDMYLFGGEFDRGHDAHSYSHRGSESRRVARPNGGHSGVKRSGAAHPGSSKGKR